MTSGRLPTVKGILAALLAWAGGAVLSDGAHAITLELEPSATLLAPGDPLQVDLTIADLGAGAAPSLGVFDVNVTFDPAVLGFGGATFGPFLGDVGLGEATTFLDTSTPGTVNLFELSLLDPPSLDALQPGGFTLAVLSFAALDVGAAGLGLASIVLGDAFGDSLSGVTVGSGPPVNVVPVPAALPLMASGLAALGLVAWRRRKGAGPS